MSNGENARNGSKLSHTNCLKLPKDFLQLWYILNDFCENVYNFGIPSAIRSAYYWNVSLLLEYYWGVYIFLRAIPYYYYYHMMIYIVRELDWLQMQYNWKVPAGQPVNQYDNSTSNSFCIPHSNYSICLAF